VAERSSSPPPHPPSAARGRRGSSRTTHWLEAAESAIYLLVGGGFLVAAMLSLVYGIVAFAVSVFTRSGVNIGASAIVTLVSDLLLTLIILEVMTTVVRYFQSREAIS
jgi:uncharacterized membrane protein (DUF373 family)